MYLIPINKGEWGFSYNKTDILFTVKLPERLSSDSFITAFTAYWCARKVQCKEIPHCDTLNAVMAFLAEEPNPELCVHAALNKGKAVIRQFFPIEPEQREHLRSVKTKIRYALRTSRKKRSKKSEIIDTVFSPRSITGTAVNL